MANFCTKCGRSLDGIEICPCQSKEKEQMVKERQKENSIPPVQEQQKVQVQNTQYNQEMMQEQYRQQFDQAKEKSANYLLELFYTVQGVLTKPKAKGGELIRNQRVSIILGFLIVQGIFSALFAMFFANKISSDMGSILSLLDLDSYLSAYGMEMPVARVAIVTLIGSVLLSVLLAGLVWLAGVIMKIGCTFKEALGVAAVRSSILIPIILVSVFVAVLNAKFGFCVYLLGNIFGFCYMITGFQSLLNDGEEKTSFIISVAISLFIIIGIFVMTKLAVYYLPDTIWSAIKTGRSLYENADGVMDWLGEIF